MTFLALQRESRDRVVRFIRGGICFSMALVTIYRCAGIFLARMSAMACFAVGHRVRAGQREAFHRVKIKRTLSVLPIARSMAILAVQAKLAVVVVGVAINTTGPDMAKDRLLVTTDALGNSMRTHQVKTGRGVVEFE